MTPEGTHVDRLQRLHHVFVPHRKFFPRRLYRRSRRWAFSCDYNLSEGVECLGAAVRGEFPGSSRKTDQWGVSKRKKNIEKWGCFQFYKRLTYSKNPQWCKGNRIIPFDFSIRNNQKYQNLTIGNHWFWEWTDFELLPWNLANHGLVVG